MPAEERHQIIDKLRLIIYNGISKNNQLVRQYTDSPKSKTSKYKY